VLRDRSETGAPFGKVSASSTCQLRASFARNGAIIVSSLVRTEAELAAIADCEPFPPSELAGAEALNIAFLTGPPDEQSAQRLMALRTETDD
jgi:uncharacterized protein (DUF1697 family)